MNIYKGVLKISLKRLYSSCLSEMYIVNSKKFSNTCSVSQALRVNPAILDRVNTESGYFRHYVATDPSFADIYLNESMLQENAESTNELVLFLRNKARNTVTARDDFNKIEPSLFSTFKRTSCTVLDFIEIFYFILNFGSILETLKGNTLLKILSQRFCYIEYESHRRMLTLFLLIAHDRRIPIPDKLLSHLEKNLSLLTKSELVAAFYVISQRKYKITNNHLELATLLSKHLKEMTANEVATISLGCFRSELSLGACVGDILLDFLVNNIEHLNAIQVGAISKCVYYMHDKYEWEKVNKLLDKVFLARNRFTTISLIHLSKIKADKNFIQSKYLDMIKEELMKEERPRIKDIERFLMIKIQRSSSSLDSEFLNFIEETVSKSKEDCMAHPRAFISLVHYLVVLNIFKEDWIHYILSLKYLTIVYNSLLCFGGNELCSIDCSLELERPSYKGNRYPNKTRSEILKKNYKANFSGLMSRDTFALNNLLIEIFGTENVICRIVLPHFPYPYSLMCFEKGREPLPILTAERGALVLWMWEKKGKGAAFVPNFPKFRSDSWLVFVVKSPNVMADDENLNLMFQFKVRQLKALRLNPVMVDSEALRKFEANEEKKHYMINIINEAVNSINNARGTRSRGG